MTEADLAALRHLAEDGNETAELLSKVIRDAR